jgi:hypothetical protein
VGGKVSAATTDAMGRAEFMDLSPGAPGQAAATVDGEAMESQPFTVPSSGGLRVILVAGIAKAAERRAQQAAQEAAAPPVKGTVVFGGNSRVLMQFTDDTLQVYYVLDVVNNARARVDVGGPLIIDLPPGSGGATALEGSSKSATVTGNRITITGPFAAGTTSVQVAVPAAALERQGRIRAEVAGRVPAGHRRRPEGRGVDHVVPAAADDHRCDHGQRHRVRTGPRRDAGGQ